MKTAVISLKTFGLMFLVVAFVTAMVMLPLVASANESTTNSWNWNRGYSWSPWHRDGLFENNNLANLIVLSSLFGNGNLFGSSYGYGGGIFGPSYSYGWGNNIGNLLILDQLFSGGVFGNGLRI